MRSIFGRHLAVVDGLGAVVRCLSVSRGTSGTLACRMLTLARCAIPSRSIEITRRIVTRLSFSVTLLGLSVAHVRSQIAVSPFDIALDCGLGGVVARIRAAAVLIWACQVAVRRFSHVSRIQALASRYRVRVR